MQATKTMQVTKTTRPKNLGGGSSREREDPPPERVLGCPQTARTCAACGPFGPWVTLYSTFWFSSRLR